MEDSMTFTLIRLRELLDAEGLHYFLVPDRDGVMLTLQGSNGRFQFTVLVEEDGEFLQFRSIEYLYCPQDHPNLNETLRVLGELNYGLRLLKFGWDPRDGEIAVYADLWVMDAEITQVQFSRMAQSYMSIMDEQHPRIREAVESGTGEEDSDREAKESPGTIVSL